MKWITLLILGITAFLNFVTLETFVAEEGLNIVQELLKDWSAVSSLWHNRPRKVKQRKE